MSRPLPDRLRDALSDALLTALAGLGLSLLLLTALFDRADPAALAAACVGTALVICVVKALSPRICAAVVLAGIIVLALGCLNIGPLSAPAQALRVFMLYPDLLSAALGLASILLMMIGF